MANKWREITDNALAEAGSPEAGVALLIEWARVDTDLADFLLRRGAKQAIHESVHADRQAVTAIVTGEAVKRASGPTGARIEATAAEGLIRLGERLLIDTYRLYGGQVLGDASKGDILASADRHEKQSAGHLRSAKFERMVAEAMGNAARVRDAIDDRRLLELQKKAEKAVPEGAVLGVRNAA